MLIARMKFFINKSSSHKKPLSRSWYSPASSIVVCASLELIEVAIEAGKLTIDGQVDKTMHLL